MRLKLRTLLQRADSQSVGRRVLRRRGVDRRPAIRTEGMGALVAAFGGFDVDLGLAREQHEGFRGRLHIDAIGGPGERLTVGAVADSDRFGIYFGCLLYTSDAADE